MTLRVYTTNPVKLLGGLPNEFMGMISEVALMKDEVYGHLRTKPENTFRTVNTVVKKLPFGKYRYRTHYATDGRDKRKIGKEALETLAANLSIYPGIKWDERLTDRVTIMRTIWDKMYFYSEDVDWLTMVNLVDSRFIKKIEYFTVENELDKESN